ncbi:MAG: phosphatidate cytidylyltransferase [Gemmatimonadota bacterium]|nr:phosphatidate cytidylyltransferase [Gemmatimonadota bacterium]
MARGELARRWAVALVGVPVVVAVLYVGSWALALVLGLAAGIGADECYRLARQKGVRAVRRIGILATAAVPVLASVTPSVEAFATAAVALLTVGVLVTLMSVTFENREGEGPLITVAATLLAPLYIGLPLAMIPLLLILPDSARWVGAAASPWAGVAMVALPLTATWVGDATAFFAGSAWGRRRLAPRISPNKSWEGAFAGVGGAAVGSIAWLWVVSAVLPAIPLSMFGVALVGGLLGVAAIVGDLVESVLKRDAGVKDSGSLLPGHGGVLDRIDALLFTLPVSYGLLRVMESFG